MVWVFFFFFFFGCCCCSSSSETRSRCILGIRKCTNTFKSFYDENISVCTFLRPWLPDGPED